MPDFLKYKTCLQLCMFKNQTINYLFMKKRVIRFLLLCLLALPSLDGISQQKTVSGVIVDANNDPVSAASITEKGTSNGTTSDASGQLLFDRKI